MRARVVRIFFMYTNFKKVTYSVILTKKKERGNLMLIKDGQLITVDAADIKGGMFVVPETVSVIGEGVFFNMKTLVKVIMPDTVTRIKDIAFRNCENLTDIVLSQNLESVGHWAFANCKKLTNIKIPYSLKEIGHWAFWGCTQLTSKETGYYKTFNKLSKKKYWAWGYLGDYIYKEQRDGSFKLKGKAPIIHTYCTNIFSAFNGYAGRLSDTIDVFNVSPDLSEDPAVNTKSNKICTSITVINKLSWHNVIDLMNETIFKRVKEI